MPVVINGDTGITQSGEFDSDSSFGYKNRLINGGMAIIQRGTQTGVGGTSAYAVDRWLLARENASQAARFTISSEALTSSDLPLTQDGLTNCQKIDVTTASGGISAGFSNYLAQRIEGFNIADIGYGTASAKSLALSFWLKTDNKTGVMSVSLYTGAARNYIQTINATTSWQKFTLTFPGDTGGSILTADNAQQMQVMFVLSAGSDFYATANQWNAGFDNAASTQADFTDSTANNIYITGVQLEKGSTATSFDFRDYGRELILCQRYAQPCGQGGSGRAANSTDIEMNALFRVTMRAAPTITFGGFSGSTNVVDGFGSGSKTFTGLGGYSPNAATGSYLYLTGSTGLTTGNLYWQIRGDTCFANAEL